MYAGLQQWHVKYMKWTSWRFVYFGQYPEDNSLPKILANTGNCQTCNGDHNKKDHCNLLKAHPAVKLWLSHLPHIMSILFLQTTKTQPDHQVYPVFPCLAIFVGPSSSSPQLVVLPFVSRLLNHQESPHNDFKIIITPTPHNYGWWS